MKEISRLKSHVDIMKKELDYTTKQIKLLEKNRKVSEWEKIDHINGKSIDDSLTHKGTKGFSSTYFTGWAGALKHITTKDMLYNIPTDFNVITSNGGEGDVIITLSNLRDGDGYTGYTKSVVDGNEILKSFF